MIRRSLGGWWNRKKSPSLKRTLEVNEDEFMDEGWEHIEEDSSDVCGESNYWLTISRGSWNQCWDFMAALLLGFLASTYECCNPWLSTSQMCGESTRSAGGKLPKLAKLGHFGKLYEELLPWKLTWHWKIPIFNRTYIFKWWMFHCHVSFRGGSFTSALEVIAS